ncbi:MAG: GGDEF domain-containing protein [Sulfuritalea sp.]|jgi:diguanylate cyclase (GGDEF)-like protein|nr:GGDEF domain-containing protein [Sulfuritalea sp.]MDP1983240.1 GGDEF domain-containing protein [Sulfuritalea sp.]
MFGLDVRSIILLAGVMSLLMGVVLFFLRRNYPPSIKGLGEWAAAPPVIFVATVTFAARGVIPVVFSIMLANLLLFAGTSLFYFGSQRFFGLKPSIRFWSSLSLLTMIPLAWFTLAEPHHGVRVAIVAAFMAALSFAHGRLIFLHGPRRFSSFFTGGAMAILTLAQLLRLVTAFELSPADGIFDNTSPMQTAYVAIYAFTVLMASIGMVLMATDKLRAEFEHLASHDSLTGALTRRALIDVCERELERCRRKGYAMSLLMLDLDHFKAINDTHGHLVGDRVLVDFVARVTTLLRLPDTFGRFGGEEFVAVLPETSLEQALLVAERIRAEIASLPVPSCTVSIGAATSAEGDASVDALLAQADAALYQAKAAGRNCVRTTG